MRLPQTFISHQRGCVTRVASHAYVNPLVAVALGYLVAGEELTVRMLLASSLVLASVFLILREPQPRTA